MEYFGNDDQIELTGVNRKSNPENPTDAGDGPECDDVMMRNSVRPQNEGDRDMTQEGSHELEPPASVSSAPRDNADGMDVFSPDTEAASMHSVEEEALNKTLEVGPLLSTNQYHVRKMAAQALMDVALMMANISQLRTLITYGPSEMEYFIILVTFVSISLACQVAFAILMFMIWMREADFRQKQEYFETLKELEEKGDLPKNTSRKVRDSWVRTEEEYRQQRYTNHLNYGTMVLVFFITVTNMFITGFGIKIEEK